MEHEDRKMFRRIGILSAFAFLLFHTSAFAHDQWANNQPVPAWVKSSCCGPEDVHHLTKDQVKALPAGWQVDGYKQLIGYNRTLPSQDGDYWIFYKDFPDGTQTPVYCFFAPPQGS